MSKPTGYRLDKIFDMLEEYSIEIVSYGLAPNPNGFCFESEENKKITQRFSGLLEGLNHTDEAALRKYLFGGSENE